MTNPASWAPLLVMIVSLVAGCTQGEEASPESPTVRPLHHTGSRGTDASREIIENETGWSEWWASNTLETDHEGKPTPAPPSGADFNKEILVAVTSGERSNTCIDIRVANATWQGPQLEVALTTYEGGTTCRYMLTNIADVVAISPRAPIIFRESTAPFV